MSENASKCPFCGSSDISDGEMLTEKESGERVTQSQCRGCGAFGPEAITDGPDYGDVRAIAAWNTRAPAGQAVTDAMVERARKAHSVDRISNGEIIDSIAGAHYGERLIRGIIEAALSGGS